jgi:hypothetical protein
MIRWFWEDTIMVWATPLENSFRIELDNNESNTSVNEPLIFSRPTKFMSTLFIPHISDNTIMESILSSSAAENATALLVCSCWHDGSLHEWLDYIARRSVTIMLPSQ